MERTFIKGLATHREGLIKGERWAYIIAHAIEKCSVPKDFKVPELDVNTWYGHSVYVTLWSWPLEASCGFVAELEELLNTEAKVGSLEDDRVRYNFFEGLPFAFHVQNMHPANCRIETEGETTFKKATKIVCD